MASENPCTFPGSHKCPVTLSRIMLFTPPEFAPITGVPLARDSRTTLPNVSVGDGKTNRSEAEYTSASCLPVR